jgi:acetyltransferase-like isoleucine patch superfamily enzyme
MNVGIYEEEYPNRLHPLSLLTPVFELRFGFRTILSRIRDALGEIDLFMVPERFQPILHKKYGEDKSVPKGRTLLVNSSTRPNVYERIKGLKEGQAIFQDQEFVALAGRVPERLTRRGLREEGFEILEGASMLIEGPWELIEGLKEGIRGRGVVYGRNVRLEEPVYVDTYEGPILIADGVKIEAFTRISGPAYIGKNSVVHSARINPYSYVGDVCRIGGEVEFSIMEPYSNKTHHGYLGHSYVSSFVNIGAGATTSDLKNTYGTVRVDHLGKRIDTGLRKLGSFISAHAKISINASIYSGKKVGAASHVHGLVEENVPPFVIYEGKGRFKELLVESAIETASRMKERRGLILTKEEEELIRKAFEMSRSERDGYG